MVMARGRSTTRKRKTTVRRRKSKYTKRKSGKRRMSGYRKKKSTYKRSYKRYRRAYRRPMRRRSSELSKFAAYNAFLREVNAANDDVSPTAQFMEHNASDLGKRGRAMSEPSLIRTSDGRGYISADGLSYVRAQPEPILITGGSGGPTQYVHGVESLYE